MSAKVAELERELKELRNRYGSFVQQSTDAVWCYEYVPPIPTDAPLIDQVNMLYDGVLVECNRVAAKSYGCQNPDEVIGKSLLENFNVPRGSLDNLFESFIHDGYKTVDCIAQQPSEDGSIRYFRNNGLGIIEMGKLSRVWGTFREVTNEHVAQLAVSEKQNRYQRFAQASFEGVAISEKGVVIEANEQIASMMATRLMRS